METLLTIIYASLIAFTVSASLTWMMCHYLKHKFDNNIVAGYGGSAIFVGVWVGFIFAFPNLLMTQTYLILFVATFIVLLTGIFDDYYCLKPWQKSLGILLPANLIYLFTDIEFSSVFLPHIHPVLFQILTYVLMMIWIYFVTNAINLLDGIDGLAGSITVTSLIAMIVTTISFSMSIRVVFLTLLLLLTLAILGFLPFNWYPAKIYLGDTGALFIGFMFAVLGVSNLKNATFFAMLLPLLVYMVPVFDTSYAIFRRLLSGNSIAHRDQEHLHHRLTRLGYSSPQAVRIMIGITMLFSMIGMAIQYFREYRLWIIIITIIIVIALSCWMYYLGNKAQKDKGNKQ